MITDPIPIGIDANAVRASERLASLRKALPQFESNERKYMQLWIKPSHELMQSDQKLNYGKIGQKLESLSQNVLDFRDKILCPHIY